MTAIVHLRPRDYTRQPWKNGGGTTTELCRDERSDRWLWRLSIADIERSGPFSDFGGYRRFIVPLEGRGMALSFDGAAPVVLDRPYRPFAFDGGSRTECTLLDGPVRDLNLVADEARIDASLEIHRLGPGTPLQISAGEIALLHAIAGNFAVTIDDRRIVFASGETLRLDGANVSVAALDDRAVLAHAAIECRR